MGKIFNKKGQERENLIADQQAEIARLNQTINDLTGKNEVLDTRCKLLLKDIERLKIDINIKDNAMGEISKIAMSEANKLVSSASYSADLIISEALNNAKMILLGLTHTAKINQEAKDQFKAQIDELLMKIDQFESVELPDVRWLSQYDNKNK